MAADTDTIPIDTLVVIRDPDPPRGPRRGRRLAMRGRALPWIAVVTAVLVAAVAAFTGGSDREDDDVRAGRFDPRAERYERATHLEGQTRTYGAPPNLTDGTNPPAAEPYVGSPEPLPERTAAARRAADAERGERNAKLAGAAKTYGGRPSGTTTTTVDSTVDAA